MSEQVFIPTASVPIARTIVVAQKVIVGYLIRVDGDEYQKCVEFSHNSSVNMKKGEWGRGLVNKPIDPRKAERVGNLGEMAFAKIFSVPVDFSYKPFGNKTDFVLGKQTVDMKTAAVNYGRGLVKSVDDDRKEIPMSSDFYVFGYVDIEQLGLFADIVIVGFESKDNITKRPRVAAMLGGHLNYDIPYNELRPISDFWLAWENHKKGLNDH